MRLIVDRSDDADVVSCPLCCVYLRSDRHRLYTFSVDAQHRHTLAVINGQTVYSMGQCILVLIRLHECRACARILGHSELRWYGQVCVV